MLVLKGGKGSGWFAPPKGSHSGEKHRSVGSGKADVTVRLVSEKATRREGTYYGDRVVFYHAKGTQQLPPSVTRMQNGVVMYRSDQGLFAHRARDAGAAQHTALYSAMEGEKFDFWARPRIIGGEVVMMMEQMGSLDPDSKAAHRNVVSVSKAMVRAGFDTDTKIPWYLGQTGSSRPVKLTLGEMAK